MHLRMSGEKSTVERNIHSVQKYTMKSMASNLSKRLYCAFLIESTINKSMLDQVA